MIDDILYKTEKIAKEAEKIGKTAIIIPPGSGILIHRITDGLKKRGINYFSTSTDFKISQHRYANMLIIITALYAGNSEIEFSTEEYIQMISLVLGINKIKANNIFRENDANMLIIITALYAGNSEIEFSTEEYIQMISLVLGINKIKANNIFRENETLLKTTALENNELESIYCESREIIFDNFLGNIEDKSIEMDEENIEINKKDINNSVKMYIT